MSSVTDLYLAQTALGANTGQTCADAYAYTFFNASANWGTGANQIGPGTTVHLCGTITGVVSATGLTFQGSGAAGNQIRLLFEPGAILSSPAWGTAINLNSNSHVIIDGGSTCGYINGLVTNCNGVIENTANGTGLSNQLGGYAIFVGGGGDVEVRNLLIQNLYVHTSPSDTVLSPPWPVCVSFTGGGGNINIHNNVMHDAAWCLNGGGSNITVANNEIYNVDHGLGMGIASDTPLAYSGVTVHDNHIHDPANWDTTNNSFHHDGVHLWSYCSNGYSFCPGTTITNINIYNNLFDGNWGNNNTAAIFFEGNENGANIFNNILRNSGHQMNNGFFDAFGSNLNILNNTAVGVGNTTQINALISPTGRNIVVRNNIFTSANQLLSRNSTWPGGPVSYTFSNNVYADGGTNSFIFCPDGGGSCSFWGFGAFANWVSAASDTGSAAVSNAGLGTGASLQAGSPAIGVAVNLTALCSVVGPALCRDATGKTRPATGTWDAGAYSFSGTQPAPPTNLNVTVK